MFKCFNNTILIYLYTTPVLYIHIPTEATNDNPAAMFTKANEKWRCSVTSDSDLLAYRTTPTIINIAEIYKYKIKLVNVLLICFTLLNSIKLYTLTHVSFHRKEI